MLTNNDLPLSEGPVDSGTAYRMELYQKNPNSFKLALDKTFGRQTIEK